jgi:hypothetical protein
MRRLIAAAAVVLVACTGTGASSSSSGGGVPDHAFQDPPQSETDPVLQRTCEIHIDIANDAADGVDTLAETRARYKDLADGYGAALGGEPEAALRAIVAALTWGDSDALKVALNRMQRVCALPLIS